MTTTDNYFKKYSRGTRIQNIEEPFDLGMVFSDAPINTGASRLLVNFDTKDKGEVLTPRSGLQPIKATTLSTGDTFGTYYAEDRIEAIGGRPITVNNINYEQVIVQGETTVCPLTIKAVNSGPTVYSVETTVSPLTVQAVDAATAYSGATLSTTFNTVTNRKIHDIKCNSISYSPHIGCFAFNNAYYCFNAQTNKLAYTKFVTDRFQFTDITPKEIDPKEAVLWGYNMLKTNAYTFTDAAVAGTVQLLGLLPYRSDNTLALNAKVNESVKLRCYYKGPANTYNIKWEWKELTGTDWTTIAELKNKSLSGTPAITQEFSIPAEQLLIRISFTKVVDGTAETTVEQLLTVSFDLRQTSKQNLNLQPENYNLHTATGIAYWQNRLVLYGLPKDPTIVFFSDINDPSYFPYPNCGELFEEPVVNILPFLDNLLVFTTTQLYMLSLSEDGLSWTKKRIQDHLDIQPCDKHLTQQVKNMVFFKSGNYYYMVVPSLKTGDLVVTTISKNIESFLDNFKENIDNILKLVYDYDSGLSLYHYYNYLDYEDVHTVYAFVTLDYRILNIDLLYNTMSRTWRIYVYESAHLVIPYQANATNRGTLMSPYPNGIQFIQYIKDSAKDMYYGTDGEMITPVFKNYQLLDTGYRNITTDYKKRFREYQLKINNISHKTLQFSTDFYIDGELRQDMFNYTTTHILDPNDTRYLNIIIEKQPVPRIDIPGATMLAEDEDDTSMWQLGVSGFPDMYLWKTRVPISGKGYSPRMRFVSFNEERFEILSVGWVFRTLYSR